MRGGRDATSIGPNDRGHHRHEHVAKRREDHKVAVIALDSLNLRPDVIKINVQGFELQVVKGGAETFTRWQPITIIEAPSDPVDPPPLK
ncbi:MAG: FkbM family methyltransferase [Hyphomicrobium sp.]